jgi:hypothetical protein
MYIIAMKVFGGRSLGATGEGRYAGHTLLGEGGINCGHIVHAVISTP